MKKRSGLLLMLVVPLLMLFTGCGGGGDGGGASTVSGVAAAGSPLVGTVYLKDSSTPAKELSDTIDANGSFSFNVEDLKPPFILKAQGTIGSTSYTLYSFSSGPGTANVNPFADIAVANAAGSAGLATLYISPSASTMQTIAANLGKAVTDIQTKLQPLLAPYNATADPVSGSYSANHLGLDGVLDMVKVDITTSGTITLTNKLTNAVIYSGSVNDFTSGTITTANIPQPPVVVTVTPDTATVKTNGTATFAASVVNSTNPQVTWKVVEAGGGTISSSGLYTAPSAEGTYHVKATSAADPTKSATSTVTVTTGLVSVTVSPASATVTATGTKTFSATVTGTSHTQVTWSVVEGTNGGSINSSGVYSAPATAGTYHVKAISAADPTKSATAAVTVTAAPRPFPFATWSGPHGVSFTVSNLVSSGLVNQYSGSVSYSGGTITVNGTDTMNQIIGGSGHLTVAASRISGTSGTTITFSTSGNDQYSTQITGVLQVSSYPPSPSDYLNLNAVFTKQ